MILGMRVYSTGVFGLRNAPAGQTPSYQSTRSRWRSTPKLRNLIFRNVFV